MQKMTDFVASTSLLLYVRCSQSTGTDQAIVFFIYHVICQSKVKPFFFFPLCLDSSLPATQLFGYNRSGSAGVSGWWAPLSAQKQLGVHLQQDWLGHGRTGA